MFIHIYIYIYIYIYFKICLVCYLHSLTPLHSNKVSPKRNTHSLHNSIWDHFLPSQKYLCKFSHQEFHTKHARFYRNPQENPMLLSGAATPIGRNNPLAGQIPNTRHHLLFSSPPHLLTSSCPHLLTSSPPQPTRRPNTKHAASPPLLLNPSAQSTELEEYAAGIC